MASVTVPQNLIDAIWYDHVEIAIGDVVGVADFPLKYVADLGHCRSMTELAIANGCLAGESVPHNQPKQTPLFWLCSAVQEDFTRYQVAGVFKQLLHAGYDKEVQNYNGETPLLHAALFATRVSLTVMELLLAENINMHAVDNDGRGSLHICLSFTYSLDETFLVVCRGSISRPNNRSVSEPHTTNDAFGNETLNFQDFDSNIQEVLPDDNGDGDDDQDSNMESAGYGSEDYSNDTDDSWPERCYWCDDGWIDPLHEKDYIAHFQYCADRDVDDFNMADPLDPEPRPWMCKARVRLKLLALLNAGCCPNVVDSKGRSPSDCAKAEGLWPQWEWALTNSGYQYNEDTNTWVRDCGGS